MPDRDINLNVADLERARSELNYDRILLSASPSILVFTKFVKAMSMPRHAALTVSKERSLQASAQFDERSGRDDVDGGGAASPASCRSTIRHKP